MEFLGLWLLKNWHFIFCQGFRQSHSICNRAFLLVLNIANVCLYWQSQLCALKMEHAVGQILLALVDNQLWTNRKE